MKFLQFALAFAVSVTSTRTFWRMRCFPTGIGRIDPIVSPDEISSHVHNIAGGGGFGFNATYDTLTAAGSCTACTAAEDHSAYWTPALYFMYEDGSTAIVPQVGPLIAYYEYNLENVQAFPEGFRMISGNWALRNFSSGDPYLPQSFWEADATNNQFFLQQRALGFTCLHYDSPAEPALNRHSMPSKEFLASCTDGLRLEIAFPSCGNGLLDSPDHKSHVAYPSQLNSGNCPAGYDVHLPYLHYETEYRTDQFVGQVGNFVLSHGDLEGYGYHGDYVMAWSSKAFLQSALDGCPTVGPDYGGEIPDCPVFTVQDDADAAQCTFDMPEILLQDSVQGRADGLPVSVPVQSGPAEATDFPVPGR